MCDSNGDSAKVTNEGRSMDEGFCHLMGAMYNDMPSELDSQTKRNSEMTRSIRSIRLPRPTAFAARYVTKVLHPSPMIVSKRFVKPQMLGDNNGQGSDQDRLLRKLFCVPLLSKIVLLITPRGSNSHMNDMFNIHAYMIEDQFHLGVTSLTASERELFVNPQKPNNYALICCSGYIHLEDAFMNASLKKNIIRLSKNKSDSVVEIECKGKRLSLQYTGDPHQPKIEATGSGKSRQLKIPARNATAEIYPLQLENISTNQQINAATSEVPLEIVDNQIEELSESNANSVEQPQPLSQIVHPSIQQNIDNFKQIVDKVKHNEELSAELLSNKVEQVPQEDKENINASIEKIEEPIIQQNNKNIEQIMETSDQHLNNAEKVPKVIVNSEIEELSESNANSVEQPQPLAQIVHQNIQQNIDNIEQIMELAEQQRSTETELQSTNHVEHNEELPPTESKLHSIEKVEQIEELLRNAMKNMPQQLLSSSTILQIKASSELRTIIADEAQDEKKENIASVEQVKETIIQEGHMKTSDLINNSKIEKQKINKLLSNEAKKAIIRDSFQWNPIDMWKPPEEFNETGQKPPTLQTFNKLHKEMLKQFQINRRLKVLEKEQIANEALNSKHKKQTNENLDQLMKSSELNLLAVENSQEKSKDELPQEVTCNCRLEQLENPSEPCEVENIQKITNDVSELLQDELKNIKDMPIEDVREVKEVEKQVIYYVKKPATQNFNKIHKERLKQFQIDRRLKKSLQSQQAANETSQSSLFKEHQLNNRPQIRGHTTIYERSISSCSQYSQPAHSPPEPCEVENIQKITDSRQIVESLEQNLNDLEPREEMDKHTRKQSSDVSELLQDELKDIKDVPIEDVREVKEAQKQVNKPAIPNFNKEYKERLKQFQIDRRLKRSLQSQQAAKETSQSSLFKEQQVNNRPQILGDTPVYQRSISSCSQYSQPAHSPPEPCYVENIQKVTDSRQIVESLEQHLSDLEPREEMDKHTRKQSNDVSELLQDELKDMPIEDVREVKEAQKQVNKPAIPNFNKEYKERLKQFQIDRRLKRSLQSQQAANETSQSSLFKEQQVNNRPQILGHTTIYQRSISSCSQYSYRGRRQSRIFSKSQPDKMLSSGGTWDVRVKQKRSSCKSLVTETRKPQWVTAGLNSKHRNYVVIHKPKEVITLKALEENYERDMSSAGDAMPRQNNMLVLYEQDDDDYDPTYCYELWPPQLLESESEGGIDESTIDCLIPNSQTILDANSTQFERMMQHPVAVPKTFSHRARQLIEDKLSSVDAKQAFHNLGSLIRRVNSRPIPHERHLQILFRLFARLDVQLFVRAEFNLPGCDPTPTMPRCRIECFFFPDRSDFIVSMAVLRSQLEQLMRQIPQILPNLHYCRDAFDLTRVPDVVRNYVRSYFNKLLKDLLAEYCYQLIQEKTPISAMPYVPTDHDILGDDIFLRPKATKFLPLTRKKLS